MVQKKTPVSKKKIFKETVPLIFPVHKNKLFFIFTACAFLVPFIIYLTTLAPTVTLEDSGELITAAYFLGVPHEPGYPLFVIFGKIFSFIPFGTIAFRVNMMSAFFGALASLFIFRSLILVLEDTFLKTKFWDALLERQHRFLCYSIAFSGAILWALATKTWEQCIIAEVYGINSFLIAIFIFLFLKWRRQTDEIKKKNYFYYVCVVTGLAITTHTTATMLIPVLCIYLLMYERKFLLNFKFIGKSILAFFAGLTPWLFLPFFSLNNPPVDWGNPENITNLFRVITRHQYQVQDVPVNITGAETFGFFFKDLLPAQWYFLFLLFIPFGIFILYKNNRQFFYFMLFFLILAIPVLSYLTRDFLTNDENKALASVFYIPAYLLISLLIATGLFYIITLIKYTSKLILPVCISILLFIPFSSFIKSYKDLNMSKYYFADEYANNLFSSLPKNALYFVNWDPFSFPLTYYQFVENKRQDILVIDQLLLKRSWYIQWLRTYYPAITKESKKEINEFLAAVAPFEAGDTYNGNIIQQKYIAMINSLIDKKINAGKEVFFAYLPEKDILRGNHLEPQFSAYKYTNATAIDLTVTDKKLNIKSFLDPENTKDRMAKYMAEYYGELYGTRASLMEQTSNYNIAIDFYSKAARLFEQESSKAKFSLQRINFLKKK